MKLKTVDDLKVLMIQLPSLVELFESRSLQFPQELKQWLKTVEDVLATQRRAETGRIAALRSDILSAESGVWRKDIYHVDSQLLGRRGVQKKVVRALCGQILSQAQEAIHQILVPMEETISEAKDIIKQLLLLALQSGLIVQPELESEAQLKQVWQKIVQHPELRPGTQKVLSLISIPEVLGLMAEIVDDWQKEMKQNIVKREKSSNLKVLRNREK